MLCYVFIFGKIQSMPIGLIALTRADLADVKPLKSMRAAMVGANRRRPLSKPAHHIHLPLFLRRRLNFTAYYRRHALSSLTKRTRHRRKAAPLSRTQLSHRLASANSLRR